MSLLFSILVVVISKFDFGRLSRVGGWLGNSSRHLLGFQNNSRSVSRQLELFDT